MEVTPVLDRGHGDTRAGDSLSPGPLLIVIPGTEGDMVNTPASHPQGRARPCGAEVHDGPDLVLITPETQPSIVLTEVLEAHDVSEEPCCRVRIGHVEKHTVKRAYGEFRRNVRMNGGAGRRFTCGGPGHEFEDQPIGILAAQ